MLRRLFIAVLISIPMAAVGVLAWGLWKRAAVSANESAMIGDLRTMSSAQLAYQSANGGLYDSQLGCLKEPWNCIPGYPSTSPAFLHDIDIGVGTRGGYARTFDAACGAPSCTTKNEGGHIITSKTSVDSFCFGGAPAIVGQTGVRAFGVDASGRICQDSDGVPLCRPPSRNKSELPPDCTVMC